MDAVVVLCKGGMFGRLVPSFSYQLYIIASA